MITAYSINYPAAACIVILLLMFVYHLLVSRRQEFETAVLPSFVRLDAQRKPISIQTEKDLAINSAMTFDLIACRNLYVGPKALLAGREIRAQRIVVEGKITETEKISAETEVLIKGSVNAMKLKTAKVIVYRKATATIQLVPGDTKVVQKRGSIVSGFYSSVDELRKVHRASIRSVDWTRRSRAKTLVANVLPIRKR